MAPAAPPAAASWGPLPQPEPAVRPVRPSVADIIGARAALALPNCPTPAKAGRSLTLSGGWLPAPRAEPALVHERLFDDTEPRAAGASAALRPPLPGVGPAGDAPPGKVYPVAGFIALEYYSQRARGSARIELRPMPAPHLPIRLPALGLEAVAVRREDLPSTKAVNKPPVKAIAVPAGARPVARAGAWWRTAGAIAAGVFIGLLVWGGASALRTGWKFGLARPDVFAPAASADASNPRAPAPSGLAVVSARAPAAKGPVAWVRGAVAKRATAEFSDTFRHGMSAWGERPSTWAPGWSRNPDGYVRPGQLALFRPSLAYANYHMEFFTEIESKSVGWVVRARDRKNYYGMKFRVVDPGLRPIIAMVHFTVLGGKAGREVEIPLSVMVHNNEPYHVAVEVKGNRVVTSIEGQEIDSFSDNTLTSGGVGFFADAGERARLYWLRVTANDDFVGKVCAYVASALGQAPAAAARLQPGEAPPRASSPYEPPGATALGAALGFRKDRRRGPWI